MSNTREGGSASTRRRFIGAAKRLFVRDGYAATSMAALIREANSSSGNFYNFFSSKDELLLAVVDEYEEDTVREIEGALSGVRTAAEAAAALAEVSRRRLVGSDFHAGLPLPRLATEVVVVGDGARARLAEALQSLRWAVAAALRQEGEALSGSFDMACLIISTIDGAALEAHVAHDIEQFDAAVRVLVTTLENKRAVA